MKRRFVYTKDWTVPIDVIVKIDYDDDSVNIDIGSCTLYVRSVNSKNTYEDIQRQLAEAER
jgi:hypothetical protein